jgi:hypothetical protein
LLRISAKYTPVKPRVTTSRTGKKALSGNARCLQYGSPHKPARSLIFGVDKSEGIWVWTLDGKELTHIFDPWGKPGNIDCKLRVSTLAEEQKG